jgi:hypothetical protein
MKITSASRYTISQNRLERIKEIKTESKEHQQILLLENALTKYNNSTESNDDKAIFIRTVREIKNSIGNENIKRFFEEDRGAGYYFGKAFKASGHWGDSNPYVVDRFRTVIEQLIKQCCNNNSNEQSLILINNESAEVNFETKYTFGDIQCSVNDIKNNKLSAANNYMVFLHLFKKPEGIFADFDHPITKSMMEAFTSLVKHNQLNVVVNFDLFKYLFIEPKGIFANVEHPITKSMMEAFTLDAFTSLVTHNKLYYSFVFKHLFIEPKGIFANFDHPITKSMIEAFTSLVKNSQLNVVVNFDLFKHLFKNPQGIFANVDHPITKSMMEAFTSLMKNHRLDNIMMELIFKHYINMTTIITHDSVHLKILEHIMLELLANDNLHEPEVIKKIAERFNNKQINMVDVNEGINFFIKLNSVSQLQLHQILCDNIDYFLEKDGEDLIIKTIQDNALIIPLEHHTIEQLIERNLIQKLQSIQSDINPNLVSEILISEIRNNSLNEEIDNLIKEKIQQIGNGVQITIFQNLLADKLDSVLTIMKNSASNPQNKLSFIQQRILQLLTQEQQDNNAGAIENFAKSLADKLNILEIEQTHIEQQYGQLLGINTENHGIFYKTIQEYLKWDQVINKEWNEQYQIIYQQVVSHDNSLLALTQKDIYYEYILNTLPYRSYANISAILKNNSDIPEKYKQKLQCVMFYCQSLGLDEDDATSLNLFVVQDKDSNNILIHLNNLAYLNSNNVTGFSLEQFKILKFNYNDNQESISGIEPSDLTLNNFKDITFPEYLSNLIKSKFGASNIIAKHIFEAIKKIISQYSLNISTEQEQKLEECCYQVALKPGKEIMIPLTFKQKLIEIFKDFMLIMPESTDYTTGKTIPEGDFLQVKNYLEHEKSKAISNTEFLQILPKMLVDKSEQLEFTKNSDQIIDNLFAGLEEISSLKGQISKFEIAYILGIIFMDMSSIHALGYHAGSDNVAFARFRLMGVYWLSKSICSTDNPWTLEEKSTINQEIENAILSDECSGQIVNKLFGTYCKAKLKGISDKITKILQAKLL